MNDRMTVNKKVVPEEYSKELDDIMDTARAINGDAFVEHVMFLNNLAALTRLTYFVLNNQIDEDAKPQIKKVLEEVSGNIANMNLQALKLPAEKGIEAIKTCKAIDSIVEHLHKDDK